MNGMMVLSDFRSAHLDYVEGLRDDRPSLDGLSPSDRSKAVSWIKSMETARGIDPRAKRPSTDELLARSRRLELMHELGVALGVLKRNGVFQIVEPAEEPLSKERPDHLSTCSTQHRGCDPKCMARLFDARDTLEDKLRDAGEIFLKLRKA